MNILFALLFVILIFGCSFLIILYLEGYFTPKKAINCNGKDHEWGKWIDSVGFQKRYCKNCNKKEYDWENK